MGTPTLIALRGRGICQRSFRKNHIYWRQSNYPLVKETAKKHWRGFSAGIKLDKTMKCPPIKRSLVWRFKQAWYGGMT